MQKLSFFIMSYEYSTSELIQEENKQSLQLNIETFVLENTKDEKDCDLLTLKQVSLSIFLYLIHYAYIYTYIYDW